MISLELIAELNAILNRILLLECSDTLSVGNYLELRECRLKRDKLLKDVAHNKTFDTELKIIPLLRNLLTELEEKKTEGDN